MSENTIKKFHVAFWSDKLPKTLNGVNYQAEDVSLAVGMYLLDSKTPELSRIKYIYEIGSDNEYIDLCGND